jgi:glucoamylase
MQKASAQPATAPGAPGIDPRWSRSAKEGVGTAYHTSCRVWFTLSRGIVSEIYFPTVDTPSTRDLQFLITDGQTFCHEEKRDLQHDMVMPQRDALFYQLTSGERNGRYRLIKHVLTDPHASVLLIHTRLEISDPSLRGKLRLYAFLAPHVAGRSADNMAAVFDLGDRTLLSAERAGLHLVFGCDRGFSRRSVGYVGASDGRTQLNKGNFRLDCEHQEAGPGNIALTGEVNLSGTGDRNILWPSPTDGGDAAEFMLGVAFGDSRVSAAAKLLQAFAISFECHRDAYAALWQRAAADPEEAKAIAEHTGDNGRLWRLSRSVLLAHEDKEFQGAIIASLSTPWGETKSAVELGGYHLVWTRDLIQSASALLATGQIATPWRALLWLTCIQKPDGSFPQNSWIDGTPYGPSIQLDEVAAPLLLGWRDLASRPEGLRPCRFSAGAGAGHRLPYRIGTSHGSGPLGGKCRLLALYLGHNHRCPVRCGRAWPRPRLGRSGLRAGLRRLAQLPYRGLVRDEPRRPARGQTAPLRTHYAR